MGEDWIPLFAIWLAGYLAIVIAAVVFTLYGPYASKHAFVRWLIDAPLVKMSITMGWLWPAYVAMAGFAFLVAGFALPFVMLGKSIGGG